MSQYGYRKLNNSSEFTLYGLTRKLLFNLGVVSLFTHGEKTLLKLLFNSYYLRTFPCIVKCFKRKLTIGNNNVRTLECPFLHHENTASRNTLIDEHD